MKDFSQYKLNTLKSPEDKRDWKVSAIYPVKVVLPEILDYRSLMLPIRDQGTQGACAAMAGAAMKEWQEMMDVKMNEYMSPQFIYNSRADLTQEGMYMRDLMEILKQKGDCVESMFPYGSEGLPSIREYMNASLYKISNYASVDTIDDLKISLFLNGPGIITVPVYNFSERIWFQYPDEKFLGGHAMCIVGYLKDGFIIRNSWGTGWGLDGYSIMSYEDFGLQWEIWTTIDARSFDPPTPTDPDDLPSPPDPPKPLKPKKTKKWLWVAIGVAIAAVIAMILL
jgi:C1A family cysteine protease